MVAHTHIITLQLFNELCWTSWSWSNYTPHSPGGEYISIWLFSSDTLCWLTSNQGMRWPTIFLSLPADNAVPPFFGIISFPDSSISPGSLHPATSLTLSVLHCPIFRVAPTLRVQYPWTDNGLVGLGAMNLNQLMYIWLNLLWL